MSEINNGSGQALKVDSQSVLIAAGVASNSRRKLIKLGASAVPVVATLASQPALAWHCKSPSAWGSLQKNPNTSLKNNAAQTTTYPDETWYITNWANNTKRSDMLTLGFPWSKFFAKYTGIASTRSNNSMLVTAADLAGISGFKIPSGFNGVVRTLLGSGTAFQKAVVVAQLNYYCTPVSAQNQMSMCVKPTDLGAMAQRSSPFTSPTWSDQDIVDYLKNNYFAL
jgi:hypothetical protein